MENKANICRAICDALNMTSKFGFGNALKEIRYVKEEDGEEWAIPVFENGNGEPNENWTHGYYGVRITADSGVGIWLDITEHFVRKM